MVRPWACRRPTPAEMIDKVNTAMNAILADPKAQARFKEARRPRCCPAQPLSGASSSPMRPRSGARWSSSRGAKKPRPRAFSDQIESERFVMAGHSRSKNGASLRLPMSRKSDLSDLRIYHCGTRGQARVPVPSTPLFFRMHQDVDARDKRGHDGAVVDLPRSTLSGVGSSTRTQPRRYLPFAPRRRIAAAIHATARRSARWGPCNSASKRKASDRPRPVRRLRSSGRSFPEPRFPVRK